MKGVRKPTLHVDFGFDRLSLLEVTGDEVTGWAVSDLPTGLVRNGDPVEPVQLANLIREMARQKGLSAVRARFTIPDESAVFRLVDLPAMPRRHLGHALAFVVEREVPLPSDRIRWGWDVMERTEIGYRICLVAAWGDVIERIQQVALLAGLELELVEPRSLAVARSVEQDRVVIFDASRERIQVLVLRQGVIPFVEQAPMPTDPLACARTLERLLRRGYNDENEVAEKGQVVLAGELEELALPVSMPTVAASQILTGNHLRRTGGMPSGSLLANVGMAMRTGAGRKTRIGIANINLIQETSHPRWTVPRPRAPGALAARAILAGRTALGQAVAGRRKLPARIGGLED